jgi:hypothetical protein
LFIEKIHGPSKRPDHGERPDFPAVERQRAAFVAQQYGRPLGSRAGGNGMGRIGEDFGSVCFIDIRVFEQAHAELRGQDRSHHGIEFSGGQLALGDGGRERRHVCLLPRRHHFHVRAGRDRLDGRLGSILCNAMCL